MIKIISFEGHSLKSALAILLLIVVLLGTAPMPAAAAENPYITFSSTDTFTLNTKDLSVHWDDTLEYSTDATTWTTWTGAAISSSASPDCRLYLRGTGNTKITGADGNARWVLTGTQGIACTGNIENLLNYATVAAGSHPTMAANCYAFLFYGCTSLTAAPVLPATALVNKCYFSMFCGCTGLTAAPELPATVTADHCYASMFEGCTSLTATPELPATAMADYCYYSMFCGCTGLTSAPKLSATVMEDYCYAYMFDGCTGLTAAPELPATALADYCYYSMFWGCTGLTAAPELPATAMADSCYNNMFYGCTSLASVPRLPATTLASGCYGYMFFGCTGLKLSAAKVGNYTIEWRIPTAGTATAVSGWNTHMLIGTTGTFTSDPTISTTYYLYAPTPVISDPQPAGKTLTRAAGDTATMSITATGAITYQWQVDSGSGWQNINGATRASYSTAALTQGNNGYKYRCFINNAAYSPIFSLTVVNNAGNPATGDSSNMLIPLAIMILSLFAFGIVCKKSLN